MRTIILFLLTCSFSTASLAQAPTNTELFAFNKSRNQKSAFGLKVLGAWSVANLATSGIMYYNTKGTDHYFHQMNVVFNSVNVLIVASGLIPKQKNELSLNKTLKSQGNTESTFIANAALDLFYISTGFYLTERAKNDFKDHDRFKGWGNSLIMQGGFLFLFDTTMYVVHKRNGKKLYNMMDKVRIGTSGLGFKVGIQL